MRQGREVLRGEEPMKLGKMRAVTINKKREIEASKERGDEMKQELYSLEQTRLYQAPAIKDVSWGFFVFRLRRDRKSVV